MDAKQAKKLGLERYLFGKGYCSKILELRKDGYAKWYDREKDCVMEGHVYELDGDTIYLHDDNGYEILFPVERTEG